MFNNIGGKIKGFAKFICWLGIIASVIIAILNITTSVAVGNIAIGVLVGVLIAVGGVLVSWIGSFLLYGFGQLIENSDIIANKLR